MYPISLVRCHVIINQGTLIHKLLTVPVKTASGQKNGDVAGFCKVLIMLYDRNYTFEQSDSVVRLRKIIGLDWSSRFVKDR
jgi:hypothetical protein